MKILLSILFLLCGTLLSDAADQRPNILWFVVDDMSANFSCYGESLVETPNVDRLALEGVKFTNAHVTAPVCSTCRSAFLTGMYQASIGSQNHRMTGPDIQLPESIVPLPVLFRQAGYFTCNGDGLLKRKGKVRSKTDYNFEYDRSMYDGTDWKHRASGQPFFMQVQLAGGKLRGSDMQKFATTIQRSRELFGKNVDPTHITLPPYYPDDNVFRQDWTAYLESVRQTDHHVGIILKRLENEGVLDETLVIFMTDHGVSHVRGKQFNYREGTHIPFIVRGPTEPAGKKGSFKSIPQGQIREDFIEHIDMAAISLAAAGIPIPESMQAKNILADNYIRRDASFSARDRCDETIEFIRSARTSEFLYIRNYNAFRPYLQPSRYKDNKVLLKRLREMRNAGELSDMQMQVLFPKQRAGEELYDLRSDPHETNNLAGDPRYRSQLANMRKRLDTHLLLTRDTGFLPEPLIATISGSKQPVFDYCRLDENYPLEAVLLLANKAILRSPENLEAFRSALKQDNPVIRYWGTVGLRTLESSAKPAADDLAVALQDADASVRITAAACLAMLGQKPAMGKLLVKEARQATDDAHALWALDAIKYQDTPEVIQGFSHDDLVKGQYSGRSFDYLTKGGLVFGDAIDYWNP